MKDLHRPSSLSPPGAALKRRSVSGGRSSTSFSESESSPVDSFDGNQRRRSHSPLPSVFRPSLNSNLSLRSSREEVPPIEAQRARLLQLSAELAELALEMEVYGGLETSPLLLEPAQVLVVLRHLSDSSGALALDLGNMNTCAIYSSLQNIESSVQSQSRSGENSDASLTGDEAGCAPTPTRPPFVKEVDVEAELFTSGFPSDSLPRHTTEAIRHEGVESSVEAAPSFEPHASCQHETDAATVQDSALASSAATSTVRGTSEVEASRIDVVGGAKAETAMASCLKCSCCEFQANLFNTDLCSQCQHHIHHHHK